MLMQRVRNSMGRIRHSCAMANAGPAKATPAVRTWLRIEDTGESSVLQAVRARLWTVDSPQKWQQHPD